MNELVQIIKDVPVVSTLDMWKGLNVEHNAIMQLIKKYEIDFQDIRTFQFLKSKSTGCLIYTSYIVD